MSSPNLSMDRPAVSAKSSSTAVEMSPLSMQQNDNHHVSKQQSGVDISMQPLMASHCCRTNLHHHCHCSAVVSPAADATIVAMNGTPKYSPSMKVRSLTQMRCYHPGRQNSIPSGFTYQPCVQARFPSMTQTVSGNSAEQRRMDLGRAKLKATSSTSALLAGFAMIALVELDYNDTPEPMLIVLGVVTTLLVSVHLLALMMSTCILPHLVIQNTVGESPHHKMRWYIELSWFFSTCLGLLLFLLEIAVVFWVKFTNLKVHYEAAAWVTTGLLVPVFILFLLFTCTFYKKLMSHHVDQFTDKLQEMEELYGGMAEDEAEHRQSMKTSPYPPLHIV